MKDSKNAKKKSTSVGAIVGSAVIGAAVGSAIALLATPQSGKDLRIKISGATDEFTDSVKSKFNSLKKEAKSEFESEKAKAERDARSAKESVKDFATNAKG